MISKEVIKGALGPVLLKAISSTRISMAGSWDVDTATKITEVARSALLELCGTSSRPGELQVIRMTPDGTTEFEIERGGEGCGCVKGEVSRRPVKAWVSLLSPFACSKLSISDMRLVVSRCKIF